MCTPPRTESPATAPPTAPGNNPVMLREAVAFAKRRQLHSRSIPTLYPTPAAASSRAARRSSRDFHSSIVTSNLASRLKKADHRQRGGSTRSDRENSCKSFVVKILTSNSLALRILRTIFCRPRAQQGFRGGGGEGGYPPLNKIRRNATSSPIPAERSAAIFFAPDFLNLYSASPSK